MLLDPTLNAQAAALLSGDPGLRLGPFLLGFFIDSLLMGVVIMLFIQWQTWNASKEAIITRVLVYCLMVFAALYSVFLCVFNMRIFAFYYGEWAILLESTYSRWVYLFEMIARTVVSAFFAARAYRLGGRNKIFAGIITPVLLASVAGAVWTRLAYKNLFDSLKTMTPIIFWIGTEVVGDLIISVYITYHLVKSRTGWKETDRIIAKLIVLVAETQLPPTIAACVFLIIVLQHNLISIIAFFVFMPNVYIISLLMVLNKKFALRRERDHETSTWRQRTQDAYALRRKKGVAPAGNIQVTTETVRHVDEGDAPLDNDMDKNSDSQEGHVQVMHYNSSKTRLT